MAYKITIIGGGSSTFTPQLMRLFLASKPLEGSTITLMDVDARRLGVMDTLCRRLVEREGASLAVESTTDRRASLVKADFVIGAISAGGMDAWEQDIEIPAKYGIYMAIADSIGPGGIMRAFRHIPPLVAVCKDLEEVSPGAWVFNYSNPATANCMAMRRASSINAVSLCTCSTIPRNLLSHVAWESVEIDQLAIPALAAGLNHCASIVELRLKDGRDALPLIREEIVEPVTRWGLETYGILPYCWSHWTEFFPALSQLEGRYSGKLQGMPMKYGMHVHDMEHERSRSHHWEELAESLARGEGGDTGWASLPTDESVQVVQLIEALVENRNEIHVVNVPNRGAIENLPADAIVEVSALVGSYGFRPIQIGCLPEPVAAVLRQHITAQELTVQAALTGDRHMALQAFLADPQIAARLTPEAASALLDELLAVHAAHLPQFA